MECRAGSTPRKKTAVPKMTTLSSRMTSLTLSSGVLLPEPRRQDPDRHERDVDDAPERNPGESSQRPRRAQVLTRFQPNSLLSPHRVLCVLCALCGEFLSCRRPAARYRAGSRVTS
jgi:hypothetical protein